MKRKEIKKAMPVKEGMQSEEPTKQSPTPRPKPEDYSTSEGIDGMQSEKPDHKKKPLPSEGPFVAPEKHPMYDPKKDTL